MVRHLMALTPEHLGKDLRAVGEDFFDVPLHDELVDEWCERAAGRGVFDEVVAAGSTVFFGEGMRVVPASVRAFELLIDKTVRRVPCGDVGTPADGDAADFEFVVDEAAGRDGDRAGRDDLEAQQAGRDFLEVARIGKETEKLLARLVKPLAHGELPGSAGACDGGRIHELGQSIRTKVATIVRPISERDDVNE